MLNDPKSRALVNSFASQWLTTRKLQTWQPDIVVYPDWDENLRDAFTRETELFLDSQLREDRSILDLVSPTSSFITERLPRHYNFPNFIVSGETLVDE